MQNMMKWSNVSEDKLKEKGKIGASFGETLSWDYYTFVKNNPIKKWDKRTFVLYGENDNITEKDILNSFVEKSNCNLEIMKGGEHYFHTTDRLEYLRNWTKKVVGK
jgi:hypothetical protein